MTRNVQMVFQAIAFIAQLGVIDSVPGITPEWATFLHKVLAGMQGVLGIIGHYYNPDGTPAEVSYQKTTKP